MSVEFLHAMVRVTDIDAAVKFYGDGLDHLPLAERQHPEDGLHRGGLARAVRPDDHGDLAFFDRNGAGVQNIRPAIPAGHGVADEEWFAQDSPLLSLVLRRKHFLSTHLPFKRNAATAVSCRGESRPRS